MVDHYRDDDFDKADQDDHLLDVAADRELRRMDTDELLGLTWHEVTFDEWAEEEARIRRETGRG